MDAFHQSVNGGDGGDGSAPPLKGAGLNHRKISPQARVDLAADVATGVRRLDLSHGQLCAVFGVTPPALRAELKARAAANGNGGAQSCSVLDVPFPGAAETLREMADVLIDHLGLDGACDLLIETAER
jgi:hypothetical protein